ncbi:hypothetical protein A7K93_04160 [Candidatus Methylacidiphilum fumarolicum]|nr:hypothetical protein A7K93_04160 [Candidatus Methylacidiphilum fumarolicum]TFE75718.1 hypothetical protein A7K72_00840 [Candidatus Methylacidiphilum fumarolicum]
MSNARVQPEVAFELLRSPEAPALPMGVRREKTRTIIRQQDMQLQPGSLLMTHRSAAGQAGMRCACLID